MSSPPAKLLDRVRATLRTRHYSIRTEQAYLDWIRRYILFHDKRHPDQMGQAEIEAFLTHLAVERDVAASTQNQALSALLFLYREVLHQEVHPTPESLWARKPKRLPTVLTQDEVKRLLDAMPRAHLLFARLLYGSGLRLMEGLRLRVQDLDFARLQIIVRDAKGENDRATQVQWSVGSDQWRVVRNHLLPSDSPAHDAA